MLSNIDLAKIIELDFAHAKLIMKITLKPGLQIYVNFKTACQFTSLTETRKHFPF